jgi:uncharacterized membrane protein
MSEQVNGGAQQPEMPQPTPVFDVTFQHFYSGQVFKQLWIFFYIGVAFFVGAVLPWEGSAVGEHPWHAPGMMQAILIIFSLACVIGGFVGLKGRRPAMTPLMFTEMIAIMFVAIFAFQATNKDSDPENDPRLAAIESEMAGLSNTEPRWIELNADRDAIFEGKSILKDIFVGPFSTMTMPPSDPERQQFLESWHTFGTGFYVTALTSVFTLIFMVITIMGASKANKIRKEEMAEQRSAARRANTPKKDSKGGDADKS